MLLRRGGVVRGTANLVAGRPVRGLLQIARGGRRIALRRRLRRRVLI